MGRSFSQCDIIVPQGSMIGPALFLVSTNSIKSGMLPFADDTMINTTADKGATLQQDLNVFELWEFLWDFEFNPANYEPIKFSSNWKNTTNNDYVLYSVTNPKVHTMKYLGMKRENDLKVNLDTSYILGKAFDLGVDQVASPKLCHPLSHLLEGAYK